MTSFSDTFNDPYKSSKLSEILNSIDEAIFELDNQGTFLYVNAEVCRIFKKSAEQLIGKNIRKELSQEMLSAFYGIVEKVFKERIKVIETIFIPSIDPPVLLKVIPSTVGAIIQFIQLPVDNIGELKEKVESLNRANYILNSVNEACYELDKNAHVVFVNKQALEWWGLEEQQVVGRNIWELFPESISTGCFDIIQINALNNSKQAEYDYLSAVLKKWITLKAIPIESGCIVVFREIDELKKAEQELRESKNLLEGIAEIIPDIISLQEYPSREVIFFNRTSLSILGYDKDDLTKMSNEGRDKLIYPDDMENLNRYWENFLTLSDEDVNKYEYRAKSKANGWLWLQARGKVFQRDVGGKPITILNIVQDITLKKKNEQDNLRLKDEVAQKATDKYLSLFNSIDEGFCILELLFDEQGNAFDYRYIDVNPALEKHTGIKDVIGRTVRELIGGTDPSGLINICAEVYFTGKSIHFTYKGQYLQKWFELNIFRFGNLEERQVAVLFKDVTEMKLTEEALRESESRLAALVDAVPVAIGLIDINGKFILANKEMQNFIPTNVIPSVDESRKGRWIAWNEDGSIIESKDWPSARALRGELVVPGIEMLYNHNDGTKTWTRVSSVPIKNSEGKVTLVVSAVTDIDELKKSTAALLSSKERNALLLKLSDTLRQLTDPIEMQYEAARIVAEKLNCDHGHYAEIAEDENILMIHKDYVNGNIPSISGIHKIEDFGPVLDLGKDSYFAINDIQDSTILSKEEKGFLNRLKICSLLFVGLFKHGKRVAHLAVYSTKPRVWTQFEIVLLQDAAERTWIAVERAKAEEVLRISQEKYRLNLEEKVNERTMQLTQSMEQLRTVVENTSSSIMVLKAVRDNKNNILDFEYLFTNAQTLTSVNKTNLIGKRFNEEFPNARSVDLFSEYVKVVETGIDWTSIVEVKVDDDKVWSQVYAKKMNDGCIVTYFDITARKKAEEELLHLKLSKQKEILNAILNTQEEERKKISESLHNDLGQLLYAIKIRTESIQPDPRLEMQNKLKSEVDKLLEDAIDQTRNISRQLSPQLLHTFGLKESIEEIISHFRSSTLYFSYKFKCKKERFDPDLEMTVFRIVQELVNNIVKHSKANIATISIECQEQTLTIVAKDNGQGFDDINNWKRKGGLGMQMIENRVKLLNGTMNLESNKESGTKITIVLNI